ncbi:hypothetical protein [Dinoroseobacter sp. S124A]|uniref:hypothetical protein n=1 Tax=Dinoroseobacter sp. S124A TaxID=3415128 RepID=UPI003C7B137A
MTMFDMAKMDDLDQGLARLAELPEAVAQCFAETPVPPRRPTLSPCPVTRLGLPKGGRDG